MNYFQFLGIGFGLIAFLIPFYMRVIPWDENKFIANAYTENRPIWIIPVAIFGLALVGFTWYKELTTDISYSIVISIMFSLTAFKAIFFIFDYQKFQKWVAGILSKDKGKKVVINLSILLTAFAFSSKAICQDVKLNKGDCNMLKVDESCIASDSVQLYQIKNGYQIYCRTVKGNEEGKTAIFIHGGGSGGNHTMLWRPAKWLIEKGLFSTVILPDRRGEGNSSPLTEKLSIMDHAQDMQLLLDELKINGKITAIGLSYGGPISLQLASIDSRINEVILMASSPSLRDVKGFRGFLYKNNLLEPFAKMFYKKNLGNLPPEYPNFDGVYDLKTDKELMNYFVEAIKKTDKSLMQSLLFQNASTLDKNNSCIDKNLKMNIPIYQVIGSKDEIWETDLTHYKNRFPNIKSYIVKGEKHKGVMLRSSLFYDGLLDIYRQ